MSREIKFRAWLDGLKEILDVDCISFESETVRVIHKKMKDTSPVYDVTGVHAVKLMQFTGLTDKNGKEIYEGDVVRAVNDIGIIVFRDAMFIVEWQWKTIRSNMIYYSIEQIEVIGNIHEHQHLMEKQ